MIDGTRTPGVLRLFGVAGGGTDASMLRHLAGQAAQLKQASGSATADATPAPSASANQSLPTDPSLWDLHEDWRRNMRDAVAAGVVTVDLAARLEEIRETNMRLLDGSLSPISEQANKNTAQQWAIESASRKGLLYEGNFIMGARGVGTPGYADFVDRQTAMVNAYHYTTELVQMAKALAIHQTGKDADPANYPAWDYNDAVFQYELPKSMLEIQFNLTESVLEKGADGVTRMKAFDIRHDTMGLMLSVDASGAVTFHDGQGTAYGLEEYAAVQPDGYVPEVLNDLAIRNGKLDGRF